jgi:carbon storage regulator
MESPGGDERFSSRRHPMLVLSRSKSEQIVICGNIVVTVVDVRGDKVRLGIEAPRDVPVHRREVYDAIQGETPKADATGSSQVEAN